MSGLDLHIPTFPLRGSSLIEASAGTGKTFTIALLYTRLILQHGAEQAFARALSPADILVVTFTDAATQELKDRIRQRLVEAAACFMDDPTTAVNNPQDPLHQIRADYPPEQWLTCSRLLQLAAQSMDESAISTIHSWCYRMLREHAFDSGSLFSQNLITDQSELLGELIRDYWRIHFYPLGTAAASLILGEFATPEALLRAVQPLLRRAESQLTYAGQPLASDTNIQGIIGEYAAKAIEKARIEQQARALWQIHQADLNALLHELRPHLNGNSFRRKKEDDDFNQLLDDLASWSEGASAPNELKRLAQGAIPLSGGKKAPPQPQHPALAAIGELVSLDTGDEESTVPSLRAHLLSHASRWMQQRLKTALLERAELGFDDLLQQLDKALGSEQGEHLAATLRRQYPVAMIDEFQDTDPLQYRIFNRIYRVEQNQQDTALIMIGDPKQAIYSFRGADIHTYLQARTATEGRHFNLKTNYRSTQAVVEAVNTLFRHAEAFPEGAFHFREEDDNPVPFIEVDAKGRDEQLLLDNKPAQALTWWMLTDDDNPAVASTQFRKRMAQSCASQLVEWLNQARTDEEGLSQEGLCQAGFLKEGRHTPLKPADIAILVRGRGEADAIRKALSERGLASVYLSDRESVFSTQEAQDILIWLRACAEPADDRKLRAALATSSLDLPLSRLDQLNRDELTWESETEHFRTFSRLWYSQGVLPMLRRLMQVYELPQRLLIRADGERRLTNLLHLAEWLQQASVQQEGEQGLIRHLAEQLEETSEEQILRLESDADLIKVVTIHKSKGLEYPLVMLPFISSWREVDGKTSEVTIQEPGYQRLEIAGNKKAASAWQTADRDRQAEDMRLLYVALTRARHALWLGVAPLRVGNSKNCDLHKSAIGYLLQGRNRIDADLLNSTLEQLCQQSEHIQLQPAPEPSAQRFTPPALEALQPALIAERSPREFWWIASYSALKTGVQLDSEPTDAAVPDEPENAIQATQDEEHEVSKADRASSQPADNDQQLHRFHRGPNPGTFLHGLLEWAVAEGFEQATLNDEARREMLARRCQIRGWEAWIDPLDRWLKHFISTEFRLESGDQLVTFRLTDLTECQAEMEFMFASHQVTTQALDSLCRQHLLPGHARPALLPNTINGMLKGFIDLVFEHQGRYYVADWKSNHLGPDDQAYTREAIHNAVLEKRYDVQYALYLLALHRLLKTRLRDYDYERDMGGALYFFLRGSNAPSQGLLFDKPPAEFISAIDQLFRIN
ncbi:exodeoxyribonuclease V subunit beta [Nitrincola alkalilacustris]|uniref:exodeoxyribonuclease V subunit beta n=1 Tax=Nitrincola alkalilacustris TaxID=1571224 RepID=UPI00124C6EEB|nr:exodeoxyribonuclease V subunit beta [Nitrincola alkalilacustris]